MQKKLIKGKVLDAIGEPKHHTFVIQGVDGTEYHAYAGDLSANESLLLQAPERDDLEKGDTVEFEPVDNEQPRLRAIHIRRAS